MGNKEFGLHVKTIREEKKRRFAKWRQVDLGAKAGVSGAEIARIEQGKVEDLSPYVESLASAFGLNEIKKAEFYAKAGFIYYPNEDAENTEQIIKLLSEVPLPVTAKTKLWDVVAFNEYHRQLWGYTDEDMQSFHQPPIGSNLLRIVFDKSLSHNQRFMREPHRLERTVLLFKTSAFAYAAKPRYEAIVTAMCEHYSDFEELWDKAESKRGIQNETQLMMQIVEKMTHPEFGELELLSSNLPRRFGANRLGVNIYTPLITSETPDILAALKKRVDDAGGNRVYRFPSLPLD